jgi:hypothetical protein
MHAARCFETVLPIYETTRPHVPQTRNFYFACETMSSPERYFQSNMTKYIKTGWSIPGDEGPGREIDFPSHTVHRLRMSGVMSLLSPYAVKV